MKTSIIFLFVFLLMLIGCTSSGLELVDTQKEEMKGVPIDGLTVHTRIIHSIEDQNENVTIFSVMKQSTVDYYNFHFLYSGDKPYFIRDVKIIADNENLEIEFKYQEKYQADENGEYHESIYGKIDATIISTIKDSSLVMIEADTDYGKYEIHIPINSLEDLKKFFDDNKAL